MEETLEREGISIKRMYLDNTGLRMIGIPLSETELHRLETILSRDGFKISPDPIQQKSS